MTTSREIKSALTKAFKGVKFSVTTRNVCCETVTVEWTGGPFINEVKAITEPWNTFEDHSDSMTDYFSYRGTEIKFERNLTYDEMEFLAVGIPKVYYSNVDGYEITFDYDRQRFEAIGSYNSWVCRENNQTLREWGNNGLAVTLEESPQAIEAAYQAREKEIENARKEREEKRGELIQGDYDGSPADENLGHIIIHWHEAFEFIAQDRKFKSFKSAHDAIEKACIFHENEDTNMGKVGFSVVFRDGYNYEGRLYVSPNEDHPSKTDNIIGDHCVEFLTYGAENGSYGQGEGKEEYQELLDKYRFEDATPADDVIVTDSKVIHFQSFGRVKRNVTSDNQAIAAEWLLDDDHRENVLTIAKNEKVESVELHTMFTESATKESLLEKYSQWVAKKLALGQANKIITFDDWQDIHTA